MCNIVILEEDRYPKMLVSHPFHGYGWLTYGDSNMMHLWFDGGCFPKVLIDNDDLSHSEEFDNDFEKDFAINAE